MATLALAEQTTLSHLPAITGPEVTTLAAQFLALAPLIAAVILLIAALSAGGRRLPAAEIVPRRARDRKIGG
ncbi:hypothetical protein [Pleomorphomonas sp. NRK KF1]|uniref:hypothetical protein n=1 Tax=Pleomorphomonas sp. NRK KF1 TaxID=2943000 RepID=UPI002042FBB5|nr:hypothetical protein [Pleomorphomonas sp. NRK KF1]MCM5552761.1 hypothetical protein [Pleomorphomonas sp. NRK KF1]